MTREITGTYGGSKIETTIYIYEQRHGGSWYACDGSTNVNLTYDDLSDGVDVEGVNDEDTFQSDKPIDSGYDLETEVDDYLNG